MENVITLGKLIGLLLCHPSSLFFFFLKTPKDKEWPRSSCNGDHFSSLASCFSLNYCNISDHK